MNKRLWLFLLVAFVSGSILVSAGACQSAATMPVTSSMLAASTNKPAPAPDNLEQAPEAQSPGANDNAVVLESEPVPKVEVLAAVLAISRNSSELVAIGTEPTALSMTRESLGKTRAGITSHGMALEEQITKLKGKGFDARAHYIAELVNTLTSNMEKIREGRLPLLRELAAGVRSRRELGAKQLLLRPATITREDELYYDLLANFPEEGADTRSLSKDDLIRYTEMSKLNASATMAFFFLSVANTTRYPEFVALVRESYDSTANRIEGSIENLEGDDISEEDRKLLELAQQILDVGKGENNYFDQLEYRLQLIENERTLINESRDLLDQLQEQVMALSDEVQGLPAPPIPTGTAGIPLVPGVTATQILFGQSAALTGPSAALGQGMQQGIQAAFHEVNEAGGVHGREIVLHTLDDGYEADLAFEKTQQLIHRAQVFGLIGEVGTPTSRAASPLAHAAGVPFIGPFTGAQFLREEELNNVLNFRASYYQETEKMVDLLDEAGITRVAVLYQNDSFGIDGLTGIRHALASRDGMEEVASQFYVRNTSAVKSAASWIAASKPEAVIIIGSYAPAARIIGLLRQDLDSSPIFMAVSFVGSKALAEALGDEREGVYVTQVVPLPSNREVPIVNQYLEALSAFKPDAEPGFISLEGYITGRLAIDRLQVCGSEINRECFLNVLNEPTSIDINGIQLQYGPGDNQGSETVILTHISSDGTFEQVEKLPGVR